MTALEALRQGLESNRQGRGGVAVSVCSAHPLVLRSAFRSVKKHDTFALVEATSNQVDQYGGYTGMKPPDFAQLVREVAAEEGLPEDWVLLGGDHLGTNTWRARPAEQAMAEALELVRAYVRAGFRKIHLDASFVCADDRAPLTDQIVAERCARMAAAAEEVCGATPPIYVVGTEVPTPGGVREAEGMHVTTPADVERTLAAFRATFERHGLSRAWERVVGLVVQPGVEFGDGMVHDFQPNPALAAAILRHPGMSYEAHSTDYQSPRGLRGLVEHHFYLLKVGPWLTFALREGLFLLELVERELAPASPSRFREVLGEVMRADPRHWDKYYLGRPEEIAHKLAFSYSDRARYYLGRREVLEAQERLLKNLSPGVPEALVSQFLPSQYLKVRSGELAPEPRELLIDRVADVMELYLRAGER